MSSESYWITFWVLLSTVIITIVAIIGYNVYSSNKINEHVVSEAIAKGSDPIAAQCAMMIGSVSNMSTGEAAVCAVAASKK